MYGGGAQVHNERVEVDGWFSSLKSRFREGTGSNLFDLINPFLIYTDVHNGGG